MDAQHKNGNDPVARDIENRNPDSGDIVAGEQVLDEGKVAPDQDDLDNDQVDHEDLQYAQVSDPQVSRGDAGAGGGVAESRDDARTAARDDIARAEYEAARNSADMGAGADAGRDGSGDSAAAGGGPISGAAEGEPESSAERLAAADERTDSAAPPEQEEPG
jgi:hypothetical protein